MLCSPVLAHPPPSSSMIPPPTSWAPSRHDRWVLIYGLEDMLLETILYILHLFSILNCSIQYFLSFLFLNLLFFYSSATFPVPAGAICFAPGGAGGGPGLGGAPGGGGFGGGARG